MSWEYLGTTLLTASLVRSAGLAIAAWLMLRVLRIRHPASRHAVWTAVLIGMMMLPVVSLIAPHWKLPVLPRKHDATAQALAPAPTAFTGSEPLDTPGTTTASKVSSGKRAAFEWPTAQALVLWCYLAGLFAMVIYRVVGWALLWRVVSGSRRLRSRRLRESADVLTPVAIGVLRPVVILPAGWRNWDANTRRAVLAHEFAHLRRHDTLVSALARLAQCVFWFHPLAWWVSRKISNLAELACDAAALERVDDPVGYSRILLEFAGAVNRAGYRVALPGLAMAASSGMDRRIDQVFELSSGKFRKLSRPVVLLTLTGVPIMCLAATAGLSEPSARPARSSATPILPAQPPSLAPMPLQQPMVVQALAQQRKPLAITDRPLPPAKPKFEVVSVKPNTNCEDGGGRGGGMGGMHWSPGRLSLECSTVMTLVRMAHVRYAEGRRTTFSRTAPPEPNPPIEGGPSWINSARYDIDAKAEGSPDLATMQGPMMRSLLEDRFQLKIRREIRAIPVYELVVAKGAPKLQAALQGTCAALEFGKDPMPPPGPRVVPWCGSFRTGNNDGFDTSGQTMAGLCWQLGAWLDRPVVDKTGILGAFDIHLALSIDDISSKEDDAPTGTDAIPVDRFGAVSAAVQKLGLKLRPAKGPGEFLVIDSVERPSEN